MDLKPDGTIVIEFPLSADPSTTQEVTLRRPTLEELFHRWDALDQISAQEQAAIAATAATKAAAAPEGAPAAPDGGPPIGAPTVETPDVLGQAPSSIQNKITAMRLQSQWMRDTAATLGTPQVYDRADDNTLVLKPEFQEPAWWANTGLMGSMLAHWQQVPLGPGKAPEAAAAT